MPSINLAARRLLVRQRKLIQPLTSITPKDAFPFLFTGPHQSSLRHRGQESAWALGSCTLTAVSVTTANHAGSLQASNRIKLAAEATGCLLLSSLCLLTCSFWAVYMPCTIHIHNLRIPSQLSAKSWYFTCFPSIRG